MCVFPVGQGRMFVDRTSSYERVCSYSEYTHWHDGRVSFVSLMMRPQAGASRRDGGLMAVAKRNGSLPGDLVAKGKEGEGNEKRVAKECWSFIACEYHMRESSRREKERTKSLGLCRSDLHELIHRYFTQHQTIVFLCGMIRHAL
jgi:hypothetical protein